MTSNSREANLVKAQTQRGSAHVLIIVILVVALVAALGWIFWQNFVNKESVPATNEEPLSSQADTNNNTQAKPKKTTLLTVAPTLGKTSLRVEVPEGWSVVADTKDRISKTVDGEEYFIDFLLAVDSYKGNNYNLYAHFVDDYADSNNKILKTMSTSDVSKLYLVKSALMHDVVLRTCVKLTDKTCYPKHDGKAMIVRLYNEVPHGQSYTGLKDLNSTGTESAISDFASIAESLTN